MSFWHSKLLLFLNKREINSGKENPQGNTTSFDLCQHQIPPQIHYRFQIFVSIHQNLHNTNQVKLFFCWLLLSYRN